MAEPKRNPSADYYRELAAKHSNRPRWRAQPPFTAAELAQARRWILGEAGPRIQPVEVETVEPSEKRKTWDWLGGYNPELKPLVKTYLHSADPAARLEAFNKLDKYRRTASDKNHSIVMDVRDGVGADDDGDRRPLVDDDYKLVRNREHYVGELRGGTGSRAARVAKQNPEAARAALEEWTTARGLALDALVAVTKSGKPSAAETERLDILGQAVRALRELGFTQAAIGAVIGRPKYRVSELERRGS